MSQRRYYLALMGMTIIMMCGVMLLLTDKARKHYRNPDDVVWMERIRRNSLETLAPVREQINVLPGQSTAIRVGGMGGESADLPAVVTGDYSKLQLGLDVIRAARENILNTSEWRDGVPYTAPDPPRSAKHLFQLKDHLWKVTLDYIDALELVYGREVEVPSSKLRFLEEQLEHNKTLLEQEMDRLGLDPVN